ncbi:MAG: hypothetical protein KF864_05225 [Phycisphaeraceae bacterium]|nr:hypothetical protein [Phycisphaeraceae bacterium]
MDIVVSPYHLTTREAPAMAALLLARRVYTLLPAPLDAPHDAGAATAAAQRVPTYKQLIQSWEWTSPLWREGLICPGVENDTPAADMHDVGERIATEEPLAPLRNFTHASLYDSERSYLGALAGDLLKGGPDPGISVPLAAGLDRFAARQGMIVARSAAASVAQRVEEHMGLNPRACILPILLQASAPRILHAREILADVLSALWNFDMPAPGAPAGGPLNKQLVAEYCRAFDQRRDEIFDDAIDDDVRVIEGAATLTLLTLPADAVLTSSLRAMATMTRTAPAAKQRAASRTSSSAAVLHDEPAPTTTRDALATREARGPVTALIVKPVGASRRT